MSLTALSTDDSGNPYSDHVSVNIDLFFIVSVTMPGVVQTSVTDDGREVHGVDGIKVGIINEFRDIFRIFNKRIEID